MTLHPGVEYTREIMRQEYLTLASLDCRPQMNRGDANLTAHLVLKRDGYEHVLCTLQQGIVHQQILNFVLHERENLTLTVEGTDKDSVSEIKCEIQYRCDLESAETEEGSYQQLNGENNVLTDNVTVGAICNNATDSVTVGEIHNICTGSEPVETSDINMDTNNHGEATSKDSVSPDNIVEVTYNCLPNIKVESEQETDQNLNSRNALLTNEETMGAIASYQNISTVNESSTINMGGQDCKQSIGENTLASNNVIEGTTNFSSHVNVDTEQGSDQHMNNSNALLTSSRTEGVFDSVENTHATMESSTLEMDRNDHCQSPDDEDEGTCMDQTFSEEAILEDSNGNIIESTMNCRKEEETQASCELLDRNAGYEVNLAAIESKNVQLDNSPHQVCAKTKICTVLLKKIKQSHGNHPHGHSSRKSFKCQFCDEIFNEKVVLAMHERNHTVKQAVTSQSSVRVLNGKQLFKCQCCAKEFNTMDDLTSHRSIHFKCDKCGKKFNHMARLKAHKRIHTDKKTSKHNHCLKKLNQTVLKLHENRYNDSNLFTCEYCNEKFCQKAGLQQHQGIHSGNKPFTCEDCGKKYTSQQNLKQHERTHTGERPFSCKDCDKKFSMKTVLMSHERIHTGEKPFSCNHCDKKFSRKNNLKQHERIHTGEKPFSCKHCDRKFRHKQTVIQHERIHTGERPFSCKHCDKKFIQKVALIRHERIHTGEKPFTCKHCDRKFRHKRTLIQHERIHTGERPFSRKHCDKNFSRKDHLKQHETTHTGESPF
ncbi:hypothetical protein HOLleu_01126 [Holothuria leucospilota]|uniref:C2H2-type domain-containing protein n=1 Tax=Holothuria leucospilota TaxID=206669 RepID=A0A9Q1HJ24_HOLLE|nr:hypothetical protein HOLleu_01126 [Holothuria leucospilota]